MRKLLCILLFFYFLVPIHLFSQEIKSGGVFLFVGLEESGNVINSQLNIKAYKKDSSLLLINQLNNGYNFILEYDKKSLLKMRLYLSNIQSNGITSNNIITIPVRVSTLHQKSVINTEFSCFINDKVNFKVGCYFFKTPNKQEFYITSLETLLKIILLMGA